MTSSPLPQPPVVEEEEDDDDDVLFQIESERQAYAECTRLVATGHAFD